MKPSWMTISISGTTVSFSGTPTGGDIGTDIAVGFDIQNCAGHGSGSPSSSGTWGGDVSFDDTIDVVTASSCTPVSISGGAPTFPDAEVDEEYDFDITLLGTAPFSLSNVVKPSWMTIEVVGSTIHVGGTPAQANAGTAIPVSFTVSNCSGNNDVDVSDTIDVLLVTYGCGSNISINTPSYQYENLGLFALDVEGADEVNLNWDVHERPNRITLYDNGNVLETTGWRGFANYGGPWSTGSSPFLNTATFGTITFAPVAGHSYTLRLEAGGADPDNLQSDAVEVAIVCTGS
jgi:hypothetical protein